MLVKAARFHLVCRPGQIIDAAEPGRAGLEQLDTVTRRNDGSHVCALVAVTGNFSQLPGLPVGTGGTVSVPSQLAAGFSRDPRLVLTTGALWPVYPSIYSPDELILS